MKFLLPRFPPPPKVQPQLCGRTLNPNFIRINHPLDLRISNIIVSRKIHGRQPQQKIEVYLSRQGIPYEHACSFTERLDRSDVELRSSQLYGPFDDELEEEGEEGDVYENGTWLATFSRSRSGEEEEEEQHQLNRICVRRLNGFTGTKLSSAGPAWCTIRSQYSPADHCWKTRKGEVARDQERERDPESLCLCLASPAPQDV